MTIWKRKASSFGVCMYSIKSLFVREKIKSVGKWNLLKTTLLWSMRIIQTVWLTDGLKIESKNSSESLWQIRKHRLAVVQNRIISFCWSRASNLGAEKVLRLRTFEIQNPKQDLLKAQTSEVTIKRERERERERFSRNRNGNGKPTFYDGVS